VLAFCKPLIPVESSTAGQKILTMPFGAAKNNRSFRKPKKLLPFLANNLSI
jgi:hypothetical protein